MQRRIDAQIIVPCLNEESAIPGFLLEIEALRRSMELSNGPAFGFLFVDNGSNDQSNFLLRTHCAQQPVDQLISCSTKGYGAALKAGFSQSTADLIGFVDLDCTYPLLSLPTMFQIFSEKPGSEMIIANRLTSLSKMPALRAFGNRLYLFVVFLVYGVALPDACSGLRLFRKSLLEDILKLKNAGLGFSIEMTCRMLIQHWSYEFIDITYKERKGHSKLQVFKDGFSFLNQVFRTKFDSFT